MTPRKALDFEDFIGNPFQLTLRDCPLQWGATLQSIEYKDWLDNPYEQPYTRGAYEAWKYFVKKGIRCD